MATESGRTARSLIPKITIITPSFNQAKFIEDTIVSVLRQDYGNLEYIVIDGGSTDGTLQILKKYDARIDYWISEPDRGQGHALNKGLAKATGEIIGWLNSDDTYEPHALREVCEAFCEHPEVDVISGRCRLWYGDDRDRLLNASPLRSLDDFLKIGSNWFKERLILQPEAFFRSRALRHTRGLREDLRYCIDVYLWMEMAHAGCRFDSVDSHWANLRMHSEQKTAVITNAYSELIAVAWEHLKENWDTVDDPRGIADDIFTAAQALLHSERTSAERLRNSTAYRLGSRITRFRFW